jgi:hypothetical protein
MKPNPCALFAVSSLGLGHATRSLVVIREFLQRGYAVTLVSHGDALAFLRLELQDQTRITFQELPDYPPLERGTGWQMYVYLILDLLRTWRTPSICTAVVIATWGCSLHINICRSSRTSTTCS